MVVEPEPVDDRHEAINGEPFEVRVADAREVGRRSHANVEAAVPLLRRLAGGLGRHNLGINVFELRVSIGMVGAFVRLAIGLPGIAKLRQ